MYVKYSNLIAALYFLWFSRGQGLLLKELVSARVCETPSLFAAITFTYDGSLYLE